MTLKYSKMFTENLLYFPMFICMVYCFENSYETIFSIMCSLIVWESTSKSVQLSSLSLSFAEQAVSELSYVHAKEFSNQNLLERTFLS